MSERDAAWHWQAIEYLARTRPDRYRLELASYLEGMVWHYRLVDRRTGDQVGEAVARNDARGTWHMLGDWTTT